MVEIPEHLLKRSREAMARAKAKKGEAAPAEPAEAEAGEAPPAPAAEAIEEQQGAETRVPAPRRSRRLQPRHNRLQQGPQPKEAERSGLPAHKLLLSRRQP
jgi:hypothetical protein